MINVTIENGCPARYEYHYRQALADPVLNSPELLHLPSNPDFVVNIALGLAQQVTAMCKKIRYLKVTIFCNLGLDYTILLKIQHENIA